MIRLKLNIDGYAPTASQNIQRTKWETFIDYVKARPAIIIFTLICIAAGLFLGGIFTGKIHNPTENVTHNDTSLTKSDFDCSAVKDGHEYQKCFDDLVPFRKFCQEFVGKNCSDNLYCKKHCLHKYGEDLKNCPCQVQTSY